MPEPAALHIQARESDPIRVVELHGGSIRMGRSAFCDVRIADPDLADEECRLRRRGGTWILVPTERATAVSVENRRIHAPRPLAFGDSFQVGPLRVTLRPAGAAPSWESLRPAPTTEPNVATTADHPARQPAQEAVASKSDLAEKLREEWRDRGEPRPRRPVDLAEKHKWESRLRAVGARLRSDALATVSPTPAPAPTAPIPHTARLASRSARRPQAPRVAPPQPPIPTVTAPSSRTGFEPTIPLVAPSPEWRRTPEPSRDLGGPPLSHAAVARVDAPSSVPPSPLAPRRVDVGSRPSPPVPLAHPGATRTDQVEPRLAPSYPPRVDAPEASEHVPPCEAAAPVDPEPIPAPVRSRPEPVAQVVVAEAFSIAPPLITAFDEVDDDDFVLAETEPVRTLILGSVRRLEPASHLEAGEPAAESETPDTEILAPEPSTTQNTAAPGGNPSWIISSLLSAFARGREAAATAPEAAMPVAAVATSIEESAANGQPDEAKSSRSNPAVVEETPRPERETVTVSDVSSRASDSAERPGAAAPSTRENPRAEGGAPCEATSRATGGWIGPDPASIHAPEANPIGADWSESPHLHLSSDRGYSARDWPTVSDILAAQGGRRRTEPRPRTSAGDRMAVSAPSRPVSTSELPTISAPPGAWSMPLWLGWLPAATVATGLCAAGCVGSWIWARDAYTAGVVAARLETAKDKPKPLPEGVAPGRSGWWATTGTHLVEWAAYIDRTAADPKQAAEARAFLERAVEASPLQPTARYVLAHGLPDDKAAPTLARSLGQPRDVSALAWTGRRLLAEGRKAAALRAYAAALAMAAHVDPARAGTPQFLDDAQTKRYALPGEDLVAAVIRDLADAPELAYSDWSSIVPGHSCAPVVVARVLRDRVSPDADAALAVALAEVPDAPDGTPAEVALRLAAQAETLALKSRWSEAAERYRQAIDLMPVDRIRRSWWINVADLALRLNEDGMRREALDLAKSDDTKDEITQRAVEAQRDSGLAARRDSDVRTARANAPRP